MSTYSPALFTRDFRAPVRQAAVINLEDGKINSTTDCASRGSYISIYATGYGSIQDAPPDGALPVATSTRSIPDVRLFATAELAARLGVRCSPTLVRPLSPEEVELVEGE